LTAPLDSTGCALAEDAEQLGHDRTLRGTRRAAVRIAAAMAVREEFLMPKEPRPSDLQRLRGKVRAFNISPKGHIEGVMVETAAGSAQLNFPKHSAEALAGGSDAVVLEVRTVEKLPSRRGNGAEAERASAR